MSLNLYLGQTPTEAQARRLLRERALDLVARFVRPALDPTAMLLNFAADDELLDLLVVRPNALIVGVIHTSDGPVQVDSDGAWLQRIRRGRAAVTQQLERTQQLDAQSLDRTVGALVVAPTVHVESRIALDIDDHRQQIKVMGLDELPTLAAMISTDVQLDAAAAQTMLTQTFGGRLWYADEMWLFELAQSPFQLHVLSDALQDTQRLQLLEGENVVGRRRTVLEHEHRLTLADDELMSNSHAVLTCTPDEHIILRDTSTNGTWVQPPGGHEEPLHRAERVIAPGTVLRMGATRVRLERA